MNALHNKLKGKSFNPRVRILKGFTRSAKIISIVKFASTLSKFLEFSQKKNFAGFRLHVLSVCAQIFTKQKNIFAQ